MSDADRGVHDTDRLPWLEAVEDEDRRGQGSAGTLVAAIVAALVALGLVVGGIFWLRDPGVAVAGQGGLIAAPEGAYKVKPADPGGMKVEGQGDAAFPASAGADMNASIDIAALPEAPVVGAGSVTRSDAATANASAPAAPLPRAPVITPPSAPAPANPASAAPVVGGVIQLGAFSSAAKANQAWNAMSGRFAYLKPLTSSVTPVTSGSATLYRLRASAGGDARAVCGKLKVAGETCAVVSN